ncbi:glyoxalase [Yoonia sp. R2-816]|uniref:glyoxalase n=1 Tax=Yoonia sp. R2-816 TaxID=3342638 RepID=UPI0037270BFC
MTLIKALDHIQLAMPAGAEDQMRAFYCDLLDMREIPKPAPLQGRGGFWANAGPIEVHFGVDPDFKPATKAHPAFVISDLDGLATRLSDAPHPVTWDHSLPSVKRFFSADPVGNRIEFIAA